MSQTNLILCTYVSQSSHPHRSLAPYSTLNVKYLPKFNEMQTNSHIYLFFCWILCVYSQRWKAKWSSFVSTEKAHSERTWQKRSRFVHISLLLISQCLRHALVEFIPRPMFPFTEYYIHVNLCTIMRNAHTREMMITAQAKLQRCYFSLTQENIQPKMRSKR